jgi:hypothetical protein
MEPEELDDKRLKDVIPPPDPSGVNTGAILKFGLSLVVIAIVVHVVVWWLFKILDDRKKSEDPSLSPLFPKQQVLPAEPRLQAMPNKTDSATQIFDKTGIDPAIQSDAEQLEGYGWVDPQNGIVRIPIDEAIKLLSEREKQTQTAPAAKTDSITNDQQ